jgi:hypothetical protein
MRNIFQTGSFLLLFLLCCINGFSQDNPHNIQLILDIGGNSGGYSINGEYQFHSSDKYQLNAKLGLGYLPFKTTNFFSIPIGVNILSGSKNHHFEFGIGTSYLKGLSISSIGEENNKKDYPTKAIYFIPSVGYRFDKLTKGIIFKIYYSPLIVIHDFMDKDKIINDVTKNVVLSGSTTKEDYFNHFYGDRSLPEATNKYGYFGFSVGYRF